MRAYSITSSLEMSKQFVVNEAENILKPKYTVDDQGILLTTVELHRDKLYQVNHSSNIKYFLRNKDRVWMIPTEPYERKSCLAKAELFSYNSEIKTIKMLRSISVVIKNDSSKNPDYNLSADGNYFSEITPEGLILAGCKKIIVGIIFENGVIHTDGLEDQDFTEIVYHLIPKGFTSFGGYWNDYQFTPGFGEKNEHEVLLIKASKDGMQTFFLYGKRKDYFEDYWRYCWQDEPKLVIPATNVIEIDTENSLITYKNDDQICVASGLHIINVRKGVNYSKKRLLKSLREKCTQTVQCL